MNIIKEFKLPFYIKATISLIGLYVLLLMLYIAQGIIVPIVFAIIISIVLHPVVNFFVHRRINRSVAIIITLLLTFIVIAAFGTLLFSQASRFNTSWPEFVIKATSMLNQSITGISGFLKVDPQNIHNWINKTQEEIINNSSALIQETLIAVSSGAITFFLVPVYIFMLLFYHPLLLDFIHKLFSIGNQGQVSEIVSQIKTVIQRYLVGLIIEAAIIAALYSVTLLMFGIDYAILIGIFCALINVIPYIGGFVGVALPMLVALATKSSGWPAIYIFGIFYIIQFIDNHYIIPKIVASKVKVNALFSIIVVIAGNEFWGVSGMFLAIPLLGILKLIFDHIEPLKPWGFLLGDTMPALLKSKPIFKNVRRKHENVSTKTEVDRLG